jgi:hypothetical protein
MSMNRRNLAQLNPTQPSGAALPVLVSVAILVTPLIAQGIVPCVHEARFGLVGLARLQTARLSVVNLPPPGPFVPPQDPCHVSVGFMTRSNRPLVDSAGEPIILERDLRPGESAFIELTSGDAFRASRDLRMPFRATALFSHLPVAIEAADPCSAVVPTLEIYDAVSGRTQVVVDPLEIFTFNP